MAIMTNKDIDLLIKMENLIGANKSKLFGKNYDKKTIISYGDNKKIVITSEDFSDFINLVERVITDKRNSVDRANNFNKRNKTYHNIMNKLCYAKKTNNIDNIIKYEKELKEYKIKKESEEK